jgi:fructose-1,6-bisphosphatase
VYGKDVGLVYKESQEVNYSTAAADFGKYVIADGKVYKQTLTGYGKQ